MELQQLQQIYTEHLLEAGVSQERARHLLQGLNQEQLQELCQVLPPQQSKQQSTFPNRSGLAR